MIVRAVLVQSKPHLDSLRKFGHWVPGVRVLLTLQQLWLGLVWGCLLAMPTVSLAQTAKPAISAASAPTAGKPSIAFVKPAASGPSWAELTPMQKQALEPLALNWNTTISEVQKRKWLQISKNFPALPPQEQATLHSRMREWVSLSPQQRSQARLNFGKTKELSKELTPEEKKAKWQDYQALSAEERQKLMVKARPKPTGAATAVKPVAPQKLATVPSLASKPGTRPVPKIALSPSVAASTPAAPRAAETATGGTGPAPQR